MQLMAGHSHLMQNIGRFPVTGGGFDGDISFTNTPARLNHCRVDKQNAHKADYNADAATKSAQNAKIIAASA